MKTHKIDLTGGVNCVGDLAVIEPKFMLYADNCDLRSGTPMPVKAPGFFSTVTAGTTRIWEYRGKWYMSQKWRDYVGTTDGNHTVVYYFEYGGTPRKIVEGIDVILGTQRPAVAPVVTTSSTLAPAVSLAEIIGGGSLVAGRMYFVRVAAETANGVQVPCAAVSIQLSSQAVSGGSTQRQDMGIKISWSAVQGAVQYRVFVGDQDSTCREIVALPAGVFTYNCNVMSATGELATAYDQGLPYRYISTFARDVKGVINESPPSAISAQVTSGLTRQISFDPLSDGFFNQEGTATWAHPVGGTSVTDTNALNKVYSVSSISAAARPGAVRVKCSAPLALRGDDKLKFIGTDDPAWRDVTHVAIPDLNDNTAFFVERVSVPTDMPTSVALLETYFSFTGGVANVVKTGDCVAVDFGSGYESCRVLEANSINDLIFIEKYSAAGTKVYNTKNVTNNYIKHRNLYRTTSAGTYGLVKSLPIYETLFYDDVIEDRIGPPPDSYYTEIDGTQVIYDVPPKGLTSPVYHYDMLFAIEGYKVRWTPQGRFDAWPDTFYQKFDFKPYALVSFAQSLIVLCEDAVYRLDGNTPTGMSIARTHAEDGIIAPRAVLATTDAGLLYVSRRGVMAFDGIKAVCLTDDRLPASFWNSTSYSSQQYPFWALPSLNTYNYAAALDGHPVLSSVVASNGNFGNVPSKFIQHDLRAFYHDGKAYFFWDNRSGDSGKHTCVCLDLKTPGAPITFLPIKIKDAHTTAKEELYLLLDDANPPTPTMTLTFTVSEA